MSAEPIHVGRPNTLLTGHGEEEPHWTQLPDTKEHWLSLLGTHGWYTAIAKWDGCIHLNKAGNVHFDTEGKIPVEQDDSEYMHICDLDDFIERLQSLRDEAKKHFGAAWPDQ